MGFSGGGTRLTGAGGLNEGPVGAFNNGNITFGGQRWPDIVGSLHLKQGWGEAQISGVIHDVNVSADGFDNQTLCGPDFASACNGRQTKVGWGVDAGVKVNLPSLGDSDDVILTGAFTQNATWYSGLPDGMWGERPGQRQWPADVPCRRILQSRTNGWAKPTAWSVSTSIEHHFTPQFYIDLEGSIGGINFRDNRGAAAGSPSFPGYVRFRRSAGRCRRMRSPGSRARILAGTR